MKIMVAFLGKNKQKKKINSLAKEIKQGHSIERFLNNQNVKSPKSKLNLKKLKSKNASACQSLTLSEFTFIPRNGLSTMIKASSVDFYRYIKENLELEAYASYFMEFVLKNEHINRNQIRILSKISGMNYICIKQNIVTRNKTLLIRDRAFKIKAIKEMLEKEKIQFEVVPEFKYWMLRKQFLKEIVYMWVEKSGRKAALW